MPVRSISRSPPIAPTRLHGGRPILVPEPSHDWESRVVLNPAAVFITNPDELDSLVRDAELSGAQHARLREAGGACVLLYRAQGEHDSARNAAPSSIGLAVLTPDLVLVARRSEPVLRPEEWHENLGVEDPRCTIVGDEYFLYYTGYSRSASGSERVRICLATSRNLVDWVSLGPIAGSLNDVANKNAALLPERVDGSWILLHRPMEGSGAMAIHWAVSEDPGGPWQSRGLLMESYRYREFSRSWIGAGAPPIALGDGRFLMIYHQGHYTHDGRREYDLAAALLDFSSEEPVKARIEPLLRPEGPAEQAGDVELGVDNVLFTCANYVFRDDLVIPYAGADSRIFGASVPLNALVSALEAV